jgi:hypothetical protein
MSCLDEKILALNLRQPGTHRPLGWPAQDCTGSHVELTAVARARHGPSIQLALRERAPHMGAFVIECVEASAHTRNTHFGSLDIKNLHLSREYSFCVSNSYHHGFVS